MLSCAVEHSSVIYQDLHFILFYWATGKLP